MRRILAALATLLLMAAPALAQCKGSNLIDALPAADRAALEAAAARVPYPDGNLWRATRGTETIHLMGTYHLDDPRHAATLVHLKPMILAARTVLVEAGPDEEKALADRVARDPGMMFLTEGPTLADQLAPAEWAGVVTAMRARGIPPFLAAKFRPWYLAAVLGIPACAMADAAKSRGLDGLVIGTATDAGIPVRALEPYDTIFGIFDGLSLDDQMSMIRASLFQEDQSADFSATLADAYFRQQNRLIWEYMRHVSRDTPGVPPETLDAEFARMEEALMSRRNRSWIPVLEQAAAEGPVFAAFGALHLSGQDGVLALLERAGFTLERLSI